MGLTFFFDHMTLSKRISVQLKVAHQKKMLLFLAVQNKLFHVVNQLQVVLIFRPIHVIKRSAPFRSRGHPVRVLGLEGTLKSTRNMKESF